MDEISNLKKKLAHVRSQSPVIREKDFQRSKVYKAESFLQEHPKNKKFNSLDEAVVYIEKILAHHNFKMQFPHVDKVKVANGGGRRSAAAFNTWYGEMSLTLPRWSRQTAVILHEMAHGVSPNGVRHGPIFCRNFLMLVRAWMGKDAYTKLRASFKEHRVKVAPMKLLI